jgi:hypothetical protein
VYRFFADALLVVARRDMVEQMWGCKGKTLRNLAYGDGRLRYDGDVTHCQKRVVVKQPDYVCRPHR